MLFSKTTIIAFAALLSTGLAAPSGSCATKAASCRSSGGASCDQDAKACCDQIQVVSPKSDGDHYQCYQDSGIGSMLNSKRDIGADCSSKASSCRSSGGADCDNQAQTCCDQIQVVSPKSDGDHYQCYQDAGIGSRLSKRNVGDDCAATANSCRSSGGAACDDQAQTCCDQIQVVSPKSDGDHYQCYQDAGIGGRLSKRDISDDCAASVKACRSSGGADCDSQAKTCCDQIQVVSPKSDGDHYQCYQNAGIESMLN
ncbi:uncharacterized protein BKCO1_5600076 [Diplodia corticola]|uniref:Uncharacterized protein n=1 Tax=Diplodia corticola TaxID=236234 RepID=A0A1J9RE06_9PEZI|nr:uncharacterized protein BKCO1_5600076 [Diplodia corticola]OJD30795.1 hypothetical protein BKCO1_5600076 [Diplodia corticola]